MKNDLEINFYHFTSVPLLKAVPSLLKKIYDTKKNILVLCRSEEELEEFDKYLWSFSTKTFLPHGTAKDGQAEEQPIFLSTQIVKNNSPRVLLSFVDMKEEDMQNFESVVFVFFGNKNEGFVDSMYKKYSQIKGSRKMQVKFWSQDVSTGKWLQV